MMVMPVVAAMNGIVIAATAANRSIAEVSACNRGACVLVRRQALQAWNSASSVLDVRYFEAAESMVRVNEQSVDRNGWRRRRLARPDTEIEHVPEDAGAACGEPGETAGETGWFSTFRSRPRVEAALSSLGVHDDLAVVARRITQKTLSPHLWKCCCCCAVLLLLPCLLLAELPSDMKAAALDSGSQEAVATLPADAGAAGAAGGSSADPLPLNAIHTAVGFELFLAAQLCLFIALVRGQSEVDFRGDYRFWKWLSMQLLLAAFFCSGSALTQLTDSLLALVLPTAGSMWSVRRVLWVVPFAAAFLVTLYRVMCDMSRNRLSRLLMACGLVLGGSLAILDLRGSLLTSSVYVAAIRLLSSGLILSAAILQARFVFYVDRNPPSGGRRILPLFRSGESSAERVEHSAAA